MPTGLTRAQDKAVIRNVLISDKNQNLESSKK